MQNEIIKVKATSIEDVRNSIDGTEPVKLVTNLEKRVDSLVVRSEDQAKDAGDVAKMARELRKTFDEKRKEITDPHRLFMNAVTAFFKTYTDRINKGEGVVRAKLSAFLEAKRKREQEKQKRAAVAGREVKPVEKEVKGEVSTTYTRKVWEFEIIDAKKIPTDYMVPDPKLIRKAVNAGVRDIPGVRIFEHEQLTVR